MQVAALTKLWFIVRAVNVEVFTWQPEQSSPVVAMWFAGLKVGVTLANAIPGGALPWQFWQPLMIPAWLMLPTLKLVVLLWQVLQSSEEGVNGTWFAGLNTGTTPVANVAPAGPCVWQVVQVAVFTPAWFMFQPVPCPENPVPSTAGTSLVVWHRSQVADPSRVMWFGEPCAGMPTSVTLPPNGPTRALWPCEWQVLQGVPDTAEWRMVQVLK
jgi:hypothetical protein